MCAEPIYNQASVRKEFETRAVKHLREMGIRLSEKITPLLLWLCLRAYSLQLTQGTRDLCRS